MRPAPSDVPANVSRSSAARAGLINDVAPVRDLMDCILVEATAVIADHRTGLASGRQAAQEAA